MDNMGGNEFPNSQLQSTYWQLNVEVEFTTRDTPQQIHLAGLGFVSLANRGWKIINDENLPVTI